MAQLNRQRMQPSPARTVLPMVVGSCATSCSTEGLARKDNQVARISRAWNGCHRCNLVLVRAEAYERMSGRRRAVNFEMDIHKKHCEEGLELITDISEALHEVKHVTVALPQPDSEGDVRGEFRCWCSYGP